MARPKSTPIEPFTPARRPPDEGTGAESAGQSGDLQGLSGSEISDNESVRELVEEGQFYEASLVDAVENTPDADSGPLRFRYRPEDDLRAEYDDLSPDEPVE